MLASCWCLSPAQGLTDGLLTALPEGDWFCSKECCAINRALRATVDAGQIKVGLPVGQAGTRHGGRRGCCITRDNGVMATAVAAWAGAGRQQG